MFKVNVYLNFEGHTEEAFNFYKSVFGGEFTTFHRFGDTPHAGEMPESERAKIMHVSLPIGDGSVLMGTDSVDGFGHKLVQGNNVSISLHPDSLEEAEKLFNGLSAGGNVTMALQKTFWNAHYGSFVDKFGISWMVNYDLG